MTSCFRLSNCQGFDSHLKKLSATKSQQCSLQKAWRKKICLKLFEAWANALYQWLDDNDPMLIETKDLGDLYFETHFGWIEIECYLLHSSLAYLDLLIVLLF